MPGPVLSERDLAVLRSFARRIDPSDAGAHNNLGVLYYQKGLIEEAIAEFARALELDPEDAGGPGQPGDRLPGQRPLRPARRRAARAAAAARPRIATPAGSWAAPTRRWAATTRRSPSSRRCSPGTRSDVPALIQLGLAEKARGQLDAASEWLAAPAPQDPASAVARFYHGEVLYNRGLNEPALAALREAIARNPDYAEAHYLLAFVYGDLGQHEAARDGHQARHRAQPHARPGPGQPRARALRREAARASGERTARSRLAPERRGPDRRGRARWPTSTSGWPSGRRATTTRRCGNTGSALEAGEDRRLNLQAMAEVHLLRRELGAALELYEGARPRVSRLAQALERARRLPAPGGAPGRGGRVLRARGRRRLRLPARLEQSRRRPGARVEPATPRSRPSARRSAATGRSSPPASTWACSCSSGVSSRRRWRSISRRSREQPASAVAWNGVGLVLMELRRFEDARNAFGRAVDADPGIRRGALQPELRPEPARRLRRRAARDPAGAGAGAALRAPEVLPHHRPPVRGSDHRDRARAGGRGGRRGAGRRVRVRAAGARPVVRGAGARRRRRRRQPRRRATRSISRATTSRRDCSTSRIGRAEPGRGARRAAGRRRRCCWATSSPSAGSMARRWSATAKPAPPRPTIPTPRWARSARCWRWAGPADAAPLADELAAGSRRRRGPGGSGPRPPRGGRRPRRARLHSRGAGRSRRAGPTCSTSRRRSRARLGDRSGGARGLQCRAAARPVAGPGVVRARRAGGGAGQLGRGARGVRARARPAADLRRGGPRARRSAAPHASHPARPSRC